MYSLHFATMPYAFEPGEPVADAVRRILIEQIDRAIAQVNDTRDKPSQRIHNARKRFKEIRAVLRMIRKPLGPAFVIENTWFRDAGRDLSQVRDADAMLEAVAKLRQMARVAEKPLLSRVRRALTKRRDASLGSDIDAKLANVAAQLPVAKALVADTRALADRFSTIGAGLERTYTAGRRAFERVSADPTIEEIHEWRKRVKDHWYHVQLLRHVWPEIMKPYADVMAELSSALGDRHDLDVLRALIDAEPALFGSQRSLRRLTTIVNRRRNELLAQALAIGRRVYSEPPASWRSRVRGYWRSWRG